MKSIIRITALAVLFLIPASALAAASFSFGFSFGSGAGICTNTICGVAQNILYLINNVLVPLLFAVAFIVFLYGVASAYIFSGGDPERVKQGHQLILWGIIAFVVMISLWGLVNVVANTFGLGGSTAPQLPTSY
jgi:hypothetical protein